jgi:hypothetical protein
MSKQKYNPLLESGFQEISTGSGASGGHEGFQEPTTIYPFQVGDSTSTTSMSLFTMSRYTIDTSPMVFQQDVTLTEIKTYINHPTSGGPFNAPCAVYELNSTATAGGLNYYEYTKVQQFTPVFNWIAAAVNGVQILTISPSFTFIAGKTYVVIGMSDYLSGGPNSLITSPRYIGSSKFLNWNIGTAFTPERALRASTSLPSPYNLVYSHPTLPSTIWFEGQTNQVNSNNQLAITVQNA